MARSFRLELNSRGIRDLLRSGPVLNDIGARGERVQNAAGGPDLFDLHVGTGQDRARAFIRTRGHKGRVAEAEHRALTNAIGAAR